MRSTTNGLPKTSSKLLWSASVFLLGKSHIILFKLTLYPYVRHLLNLKSKKIESRVTASNRITASKIISTMSSTPHSTLQDRSSPLTTLFHKLGSHMPTFFFFWRVSDWCGNVDEQEAKHDHHSSYTRVYWEVFDMFFHPGMDPTLLVCGSDQGCTCMARRHAVRARHHWVLEFDHHLAQGSTGPSAHSRTTPHLILSFFIPIQLLIPWRFFRLWALLDGLDPPENMIRCMSNNYSTLEFWRSWHRSYNLWIVR